MRWCYYSFAILTTSILVRVNWGVKRVTYSFVMLFLIAALWYQHVFCRTLPFTERGKLWVTVWFNVINMTDLSIIILSSLPRRVTYVLSHPKNCFAVRFSKGSQCIAVTTIKVEMHTHASLWAVLYPIAQRNPNQC